MQYQIKEADILLFQQDFNLSQTLDCGQAFRWKAISGGYQGYALNHKLILLQEDEHLFRFCQTTEKDFLEIWCPYFDLFTDYSFYKNLFSTDETLQQACNYAWGMRLLRQDPWETVCSFILSQNNNIPRIKGIIERLCQVKGHFPSPQDLRNFSVPEAESLRAGFRWKYLLDAANKITQREIQLDKISALPLQEARDALQKITGVGPKVAECILLYGFQRLEAFPLDVWIKRVMERFYPKGFPEEFRDFAGVAQQYLFHYIRTRPDT